MKHKLTFTPVKTEWSVKADSSISITETCMDSHLQKKWGTTGFEATGSHLQKQIQKPW